jgi:hypothetical protein
MHFYEQRGVATTPCAAVSRAGAGRVGGDIEGWRWAAVAESGKPGSWGRGGGDWHQVGQAVVSRDEGGWWRQSQGSWEVKVEEGGAGEVGDDGMLRGWGQGGGVLQGRGRGWQAAAAVSGATCTEAATYGQALGGLEILLSVWRECTGPKSLWHEHPIGDTHL